MSNAFNNLLGKYRVRVDRSSIFGDDSEIHNPLEKISVNFNHEEGTVEVIAEEDSDDDLWDDDDEDEETEGDENILPFYGQYQPNVVDYFDAEVISCGTRVNEEFIILLIKFVPTEEFDFNVLNERLIKVEFLDATTNEHVVTITNDYNADNVNGSIWFSDMFLSDNTDDQDEREIRDGKVVWALKWSKPMPKAETKNDGPN